MTTKTKADSNATTLAQASRETLAEATRKVDARRAALAHAESEVYNIESAWRRGDETITSPDLMAAQAEVTRCSGLLTAALNDVRRAERNLINDDAGLAEAVVPVLEGMLPGVPVEIHTITPTEAPKSLPVLRVVQAKAASRDTISGIISNSDLEIVGYFPTWTEGVNLLDQERLSKALDRGEVRTRENGVRSAVNVTDAAAVHRASVAVETATEPLPVIRGSLNPSNVSYLAQGLAGEVRGRGWLPSRGRFMFSASAGKEYALISESVDNNGKRTAKVRFSMTVLPEGDTSVEARNNAQRIAVAALEESAGRFASGLGRADRVSVSPGESGTLSVEMAFLSRTSLN